MNRIMHGAIGGLLLTSVALMTGCSGGPAEAKNSVSGKVLLDGQPVAGEVIFFHQEKKDQKNTPINPKGEYTINDPEPGKVKIVVKGMLSGQKVVAPPPDGPKIEGAPALASGAAPPAKYGSEATTPLEYEVKAGKQKYDINLTP